MTLKSYEHEGITYEVTAENNEFTVSVFADEDFSRTFKTEDEALSAYESLMTDPYFEL